MDGHARCVEDVHVVVKRTFFELSDFEGGVCQRERAFTDSCLPDDLIQDKPMEDDRQSDLSTRAESSKGDSTPRSCGSATPRNCRETDGLDVSTPLLWFPCVPPSAYQPQSTCEDRYSARNVDRHRWPPQSKGSSPSHSEKRTTLMLRNLPSCFSRTALLETLDATGFAGDYDFVYLPIDFHSGAGLGYCFVNMINSDRANALMDHLQGFSAWRGSTSQKVLEICWSDPHQGLDMLVERYRNSRVMHGSVPDHYKPVLFQNGARVPFPRHTKRIRPPVSGGLLSA